MDTNETKIYIAALIAAGVLAVLLIYFIITMIRQQRKTQRLHLEKIQAEILAQEKERKKIASDLHDDLGPLLSAIKFKINSIDVESDEDISLIEQVSRHIDDTLDRVRKISFDLLPNTLTRKGLVQTVEEFISKVDKLVQLKIHFVHSDLKGLTDEMNINFYRIILEIINNTIKHSRAERLKIEIIRTDEKIILLSADDGIGFQNVLDDGAHQGLGLRNIQSRTEIMRGVLKIDTRPGSGVKFNIEIPLVKA